MHTGASKNENNIPLVSSNMGPGSITYLYLAARVPWLNHIPFLSSNECLGSITHLYLAATSVLAQSHTFT
jgi:hypothetical protein